jgi:hypothetical protein
MSHLFIFNKKLRYCPNIAIYYEYMYVQIFCMYECTLYKCTYIVDALCTPSTSPSLRVLFLSKHFRPPSSLIFLHAGSLLSASPPRLSSFNPPLLILLLSLSRPFFWKGEAVESRGKRRRRGEKKNDKRRSKGEAVESRGKRRRRDLENKDMRRRKRVEEEEEEIKINHKISLGHGVKRK